MKKKTNHQIFKSSNLQIPKALAFGLLLLFAVSCTKEDDGDDGPAPKDGYTLAVSQENLQQIKGWGIFPGNTFPAGSDQDIRSINSVPNVLDILFEELGINIYRVCFQANCGLNYTADNRVLNAAYVNELAELINYAKGKGVTDYLVSLWTPPHHMKEVYDAGSPTAHLYRSRLKKENYDLFISYMMDMVKALQAKGCPPPAAISLQNEPEASWGGPNPVTVIVGPWYDGQELAALISKMRAALDAAGLSSVKLGGPESPSYAGYWIFDLTRLSAALLKDMDIFMMHSYTQDIYNSTDASVYRAPLDQFLTNRNTLGLESWQTEFSAAGDIGKGRSTMEAVQIVTRVFSSDMIWAGHAVWMWWYGWHSYWSIDNPDREVLVSGDDPNGPVLKSGLFEVFSTIFNSAPPGSYVRKVVTNDTKLKTEKHLMNDLVAFQSDRGTLIVLVNDANAEKKYYASGLTGQTGLLKAITGDDAKTVQTTAFTVSGGKASVTVPPMSVNFIITN